MGGMPVKKEHNLKVPSFQILFMLKKLHLHKSHVDVRQMGVEQQLHQLLHAILCLKKLEECSLHVKQQVKSIEKRGGEGLPGPVELFLRKRRYLKKKKIKRMRMRKMKKLKMKRQKLRMMTQKQKRM